MAFVHSSIHPSIHPLAHHREARLEAQTQLCDAQAKELAAARGGLTVVLINNHGGGIFEHLPVAGVGAAFEKFWGTPQRVDFGKLCAVYDVPHTVVADGERLAVLLAEPAPASGLRVWEVRTDRRRDARARKARLNSK